MSTTVATPVDAATPRARGKLLRVLGVAFGVAVIIGNTIGSGILRTPSSVATLLPGQTAFLLAWVAGGAYALLGVVSLAELGVLIPRSGGQYVFAQRAFGLDLRPDRRMFQHQSLKRGQLSTDKLAIDIGGRQLPVIGHQPSPNCAINAWRPRTSREVSVPIGTSSISAASR